MSYPFEPYKIDTYFNKPTSYGTHEGIDMNGLGGGNTDCGTPLKSICKGVVVYSGSSTKDYGNLIVIETKFQEVTYYVRYCHLAGLGLKVGDSVEMNQIVEKMGSTGNSTACHLHLDILKKKPSNWRFYTQNVLEWFIDPVWFINNYKVEEPGEPMPTELQTYLGVQNDAEAKAKLKEHLGEEAGKCDWGNDTGSRGGYLGSARRKIKELESTPPTPQPTPPTGIQIPEGERLTGRKIEIVTGNRTESITTEPIKKD